MLSDDLINLSVNRNIIIFLKLTLVESNFFLITLIVSKSPAVFKGVN